MSNVIPVVLISDDCYALATSVVIQSIIENANKAYNYKIFVVGVDLSFKNKQKFKKQSKKNFEIQVLSMDNKYKSLIYEHSYISRAVFYKFDIANIFYQFDKLIYLDGDIIVNCDLVDFFETDLGENYSACVKDLPFYYEKNQHQILNRASYFNSGVMLLNVKKIREDNLYEKFMKVRNSEEYLDQDVFNLVFNNKVKFLSLKYNFLSVYKKIENLSEYRHKYKNEDFVKNCLFDEEEKDFYESLKNPLIIHYAGDKPWNLKKGCFFYLWKKYFKKSPYRFQKLNWQKKRKMFDYQKTDNKIKLRVFFIKFELKVKK